MTERVLLVDDEANIRRMLAALLHAEGFETVEAASGPAALLAAERSEPDVVMLDLLMPPGPDGIEVLGTLRERGIQAPVIMMSGKAQLSDAVRATQRGAFQFLEKPLSPEAVLVTLRAAVKFERTRAQNQALRAALDSRDELVGSGPGMRQVRELIRRVAPADTRVLITGESGTGKELVAAAIHRESRRRSAPFVTVNCAAIPRDLVESEMFGHERGAFTGAVERRIGRFELADGGTLFLDEVGDLGLEAQAKLLRTLESGVLQRVGAERSVTVNVRIIAATNHSLEQAVAAGRFREDLFFRLHIFPIHLPPLRERLEDLPDLVTHLAHRIRPINPPQFTEEALAVMAGYPWPGNIRELGNLIERLAITGEETVDAAQVVATLPRAASVPSPQAPLSLPVPRSLTQTLDDYERSLIVRAFAQASGNVAEAARLLRTDRANLYRRIKRLRLSLKNMVGES